MSKIRQALRSRFAGPARHEYRERNHDINVPSSVAFLGAFRLGLPRGPYGEWAKVVIVGGFAKIGICDARTAERCGAAGRPAPAPRRAGAVFAALLSGRFPDPVSGSPCSAAR